MIEPVVLTVPSPESVALSAREVLHRSVVDAPVNMVAESAVREHVGAFGVLGAGVGLFDTERYASHELLPPGP